MRINISALNRYLECPRKWWYEYILGRGRASRSQALLDGILWHQIVSGEAELPEDAPPWMPDAYDAWLEWEAAHPDIKILDTEVTLEAPLGPHTLFGRLDALVTWEGKAWHLQHKTMAKSRPLDVLVRTQKRSFHEHAYKHLVEYNKPVRAPERVDGVYPPVPYGGTILVVCKKITTALPIHVEYLTNNGGHEEAMVDIEQLASMMASETGDWGDNPILFPIQNRNSCAGPYLNSLCWAIDACDGIRRIDTYDEIDPLEGYKT